VSGAVLNAATGQPLARALVHIEGDADTGALTDGEGLFEIPGVPTGPQFFEIVKPGFYDRGGAAGNLGDGAIEKSNHNVLVAADMPKLTFSLAPTATIRGQIELSTGDPAEGITVALLRRTVQDGRAFWPEAAIAKTNSEGAYRFGGLAAGEYALYTQTAMESEPASTLAAGGVAVERAGYRSIFYPDASEFAGARKIRLVGGEQTQANFALTLELFHAVTAAVALPRELPAAAGNASDANEYRAAVMDMAGHQLLYDTSYDRKTHTVQTLLPDGSYSLVVFTLPRAGKTADGGALAGSVDFAVAGHPVRNLRVPLLVTHQNPVELAIERSSPPSGQPATAPGKEDVAEVLVSSIGAGIFDGTLNPLASGSAPGPMAAASNLSGSYWVHTHIAKGYCERSFTAGGTNLATEPLILGLNGSTAPMFLTLRDDCAKLTLSLPATISAVTSGEEPLYTVYAVPDTDSTVDAQMATLRPSSGGTITLEDLAPGGYRVYTFDAPARLEYRNPAALAALPAPGQAITLSPGTTGNLELEVGKH